MTGATSAKRAGDAQNKNTTQEMLKPASVRSGVESPFAWLRLAAAMALATIGTVGMWSVPVVLPVVQADFGVARADASLPFTLTMLGFALGGVLMGRLADSFGVAAPVACGALALGLGYAGAGFARSLTPFALMHVVIGLGASATFGPIMADTSRWFTRRRGIAVALAACGTYLGGAIWPPVLQHFIASEGWRATLAGTGLFCVLSTIPLLLILLPRPPIMEATAWDGPAAARSKLGLSSHALMVLLCVAGFACCVAMAMPQVHIVAYCGDLGYGVARGAEMLSLMLGFGLASRIGSGFVSDAIGGTATLLIGSFMQGVALLLYLFFNGLTSLFVVSGIFGLFQGGIVPMYAVICRELLPPRQAGAAIGLVVSATIFGMAFGGYFSGVIFDLTSSYRMAFLNGLLFNVFNFVIVAWLFWRRQRRAPAGELLAA